MIQPERNPPPSSRRQFTDRAILAAWNKTRSAAKTALAVGCSRSRVYERLEMLGEMLDLPPSVERPGPKATPPPAAARQRTLGETIAAAPQAMAPEPFLWISVRQARPAAPVRISVARDGEDLVIEHPAEVLVSSGADWQEDRRKADIDEAWWLPTIETGEFTLLGQAGRRHHYRVELETNQPLSRGDLERVFALGVEALHRGRGETIPVDGIMREHERRDEDRTRL